MAKLIENPFRYGDPVEGEYYFPRPELTAMVRNFLDHHIHVVLMGPRRFGKTSFVLNLLRQQEQHGKRCLLVDIFNITSHRDFLMQLVRAVRQQDTVGMVLKRWWKKLKALVPHLSVDIDPMTQLPNLAFSLEQASAGDVKEAIQDLLGELGHLSKRAVIAIDEFQQISQLDDKGWLEATLRTHFQRMPSVAFLFTGSRRGLLNEMMNNPRRPFYRSCQIVDFPALGDAFSEWIVTRFQCVGIHCSISVINYLRALVQETPHYVQMACFHLVAKAIRRVEKTDVEAVLDIISQQNGYGYQQLLHSLSLAQQRALRLAACNEAGLFERSALAKYEITSAPALHSSLKALKLKGILDPEETRQGRVLFDDPLFAYWLKRQFMDPSHTSHV